MSEQTEQQLNNEVANPKNKKISKFIDVLLWVVIAVLASALLIRVFFLTQITIWGTSMTADYYYAETSPHYDPSLTFRDKEVVNVSKVKKPQRGDVVVFYESEDGANKFLDIFSSGKSEDGSKHAKFIKRLIALEGDKVWVERVEGSTALFKVMVQTPDGKLYQDDYYKRGRVVLDKEAFYLSNLETVSSGLGILADHVGADNAIVISANCFFALGDNRANSLDSRTYGEFSLDRLYGVVLNP